MIHRAVLAATAALAVACGPGAGESHNSSQAGATARAGTANPDNQPRVTLTGCLVNADRPGETPTGTTGGKSAGGARDQIAAGSGSLGERFTLVGATSATADSSPAAASYVLDGNMEALRGHQNQRVTVVGTLDATAANTAGPQRVRVETVDTVGPACKTP